MINKLFRYFDLQSGNKSLVATGNSGGSYMGVILQYIAVVGGVIAQPFLQYYVEHAAWNINLDAFIGRTVFGLLIGIILLPAVYKSSFDPGKPVLVQLAALFPMGIGWQSLVSSAAKAGLH